MRFGDLFEVHKGKKPVATHERREPGDHRLIQIEDLRDGAVVRYCPATVGEVYAHPTDLLLAWDGANAATSSFGLEGAVGSTLAVLTPKDGAGIFTPYAGHFLRAHQQYLRDRCKGATVPHIDGRTLADLNVPVPDAEEQRRIATILDQADALRTKRRRALSAVDRLPEAVFADFFGSRAGIARVTLGGVARVSGGKRLPKGSDYAAHATEHPYIRVTDMKHGVIDRTAVEFLTPEVHARIARYVVEPGDVVISIAGSIGLVAEVPDTLAGANLTENAARIRALEANVWDPVYMANVLRTRDLQSQIAGRTGRVTIGKLALFRIEQLEVPLPPISLQRAFRECLASVRACRERGDSQLVEIDALCAALQDRAFKGEL